MKKIAIAFGIITCLAVLSLLFTSASARDWLPCPSADGRDRYSPPATSIYYEKDITGIGYENCRATVATHEGFTGISAELSARGTGVISRGSQTIDILSNSDAPTLDINSEIDKSYARVNFSSTLGIFDNKLSGEIYTRNFMAGAVVSEGYIDTYDISGDFDHTGTGTSSHTTIIDRKIYGTSRFAVTVNDVENHHHNIMRVREEHTGEFEMDTREVRVTRSGGP